MWFMSRPQGRAQGLGKLFMGISSMWVGVVGVWLHHHRVLIIHLLYIQTSPFIRNQVFLDAGLTDWSENQLCPQTLPVLMEPLNMDSLNKAK